MLRPWKTRTQLPSALRCEPARARRQTLDGRKVFLVGLTLAACSGGDPKSPGAGGQGTLPDGGIASLLGDGAAPVEGSGDGAGTGCQTAGETQSCCQDKGTQTCMVQGEFTLWSGCVDSTGKAPTGCDPLITGSCATNEFGQCLDGGTPPTGMPGCETNEFGHCIDGGAPPPPMPPATGSLCKNRRVNTEPDILAGYSPADGQKVQLGGQIKVWITDECPAFVATGEQIDPTTGKVTQPGDRTGKAADGFLNEPAIYISPGTAESGGTPYFPQYVKGAYNNQPPTTGFDWTLFGKCFSGTAGSQGAAVDAPPAGVRLNEAYNTEFIWDVDALGLAPGTYSAEFVVHDGDRDRAVACVELEIAPQL